MAEHCHGCNNDQCLGTATAQRLRADLASEKREKLEWMSSSAKALADLEAARAETARLREALEKYTTCWHCGDALLEEDPYHCEACPAWDCCDEGDCDAPGCQALTSDPEPTT